MAPAFQVTRYWDLFLGLFKGTVQRDFLSPIFSLMESSQAPYSVFKDFSNLASNSVRYSRFFIDSRRVHIPRIVYYGEL
jgi:hypothetical protein